LSVSMFEQVRPDRTPGTTRSTAEVIE
jgi:hypothetical protein